MDSTTIVCPVCTLYLRPGITLKVHLASHPKQKVIEALVRLSSGPPLSQDLQKIETSPPELPGTSCSNQISTVQSSQPPCIPENLQQPTAVPSGIQGNHVFIYQQSMSTTGAQSNVLNVNPLSQQYVIPTVFNHQQMMPYVYQQQQVIMSSNACVPPTVRPLPFELNNSSPLPQTAAPTQSPNATCTITEEVETIESDNRTCSPNIIKSVENNVEISECIEDKIIFLPTPEDSNVFVGKEETIEDIHDDEESSNINIHLETNDDGYLHNDDLESNVDNEWNEKVCSDLNKACQTPISNNHIPLQQDVIVESMETDLVEPEYYFPAEHSGDNHSPSTTVNINIPYEQIEPVYSSSNMCHSNENIDYVEMDGMHVIINGFSTNHIISQVDPFDQNSKPERPGVLMTIGGMVDSSNDQRDDSLSHDETANVNIRTDERMPPRGELSGQESIGGASDITWNRIQYNDASSAMSTSYDIMGQENWGASDSSDIEPPLQSRIPNHMNYTDDNDGDMPTIISCSGPPLNFKCSSCDEAFQCLAERKDHEKETHPEKLKVNVIGSEIGKKKVKKLVVKLKTDKTETENNFDNVFTNKLKIETKTKVENEEVRLDNQLNEVKVDDIPPIDLKIICALCDCVVANAKALRQHKQEVHNITPEIRHKCTTCGEAFPNDYKYTEHLKIHPLECRLCGKLFYRRQNIQLHMKRHLGIKPYKCEVCEKSFLTKQKHDEHKNTHTGDAPIKCTLCDESFRRHSNLVQHRNRHHFNFKKKIKDYICFCGEIFHSKKKLAWHKEVHDSKPKACTQCNEKFVHMSSLTRHMRRAHNDRFLPKEDRENENVECPICKGVYLRSSLDIHIRNHSGQRPFTCLICNKDFTTKWNLKLHKWTHASRTSKPFKCDQCKGAFIRETDYIAHMNSHKSVRPYTCNYCGAQFIRKYNCQRHVKEHENGKTFNCTVCGKSFHRSYYLKDHMRVHSGHRPFSCHICGKTSATKSNHNKHVQIHHAREPVSTEN